MFGSMELLLIVIAALLLFGPDKMPEIARSMGKMYGDFKRAMREAEEEFSIAESKKTIQDSFKLDR